MRVTSRGHRRFTHGVERKSPSTPLGCSRNRQGVEDDLPSTRLAQPERWWQVILIAAVVLFALPAEAAVRRYALVVGSNEGDASEVRLRYAETDAQRMGRVLREHGEFPPENVLVLVDGEA